MAFTICHVFLFRCFLLNIYLILYTPDALYLYFTRRNGKAACVLAALAWRALPSLLHSPKKRENKEERKRINTFERGKKNVVIPRLQAAQ